MEKAQQEIIRTKCHIGQLVITDTVVKVETKLQKNKMLARSMILGVHIMPYPKILWIGGKHADILFFSIGTEAIEAKSVNINIAKDIVRLLGFDVE